MEPKILILDAYTEDDWNEIQKLAVEYYETGISKNEIQCIVSAFIAYSALGNISKECKLPKFIN